jgi:uncharacterized membrane protein (UPF0127 family)
MSSSFISPNYYPKISTRRHGEHRGTEKKIRIFGSVVFVYLCELLGIAFLFFLFSCAPKKLEVREFPITRDGETIAVVSAEIARTEQEQSKGLMYRKTLSDGEGMLFVFDKDEVKRFWMKNTFIPLSIAFITWDERIVDIKDMYPHDKNSVISNRSVRYALEVPQGWFSRAGVKIGDIINIKELLEN